MSSIQYEKVSITEEELESLRKKQDHAQGWGKWAAYKTWLHYANLKRWRAQGHHFHYLTGESETDGDKWHCTCGLIMNSLGNGAEESTLPTGIKLDGVQRYRGHVNLPSGRGETVALIVNFVMDWNVKDYLWDVFCQECSSFELKKLLLDAQAFVKEHNRKCGSSLRRKRSRLKKVV